MPTYEYACRQCGEHLEVVQKFTDDPLTTCPACAGSLRKVFGSIGISFKGSGFYKNDSRASENGAKKDKEPGEKSEKAEKAEKSEKSSGDGDGASKPKIDAPAAKADTPKKDKGSTAAAS